MGIDAPYLALTTCTFEKASYDRIEKGAGEGRPALGARTRPICSAKGALIGATIFRTSYHIANLQNVTTFGLPPCQFAKTPANPSSSRIDY